MTTRLKDTFKQGDPVCKISADWLNTVARWLNTINVNGGPRFATPYDLRLYLASGEGGNSTPSSFDIKAYGVDDDPAKVTIRGGQHRYLGLSKIIVPDTDLTITGTLADPTVICLDRDESVNGVTIVALAADPDDSGSHKYRPLWEMYLLNGVAAVKLDRRPDWCEGSPIV